MAGGILTKVMFWAFGQKDVRVHMVFDGKKEGERSREGARAWLGSGEAHAEENKTVPAHVTYMGISLFCLDWKEDNPKLDSPNC